ncbi:MAG: hypothetical protein AAB337_00920 [Patescibacteria group bacterium]
MLEVSYAARFVRAYKKFTPLLQEEVKRAITDFQNPATHERLRVHKLEGRLQGRYSFSVNYATRIVFMYLNKDQAVLLTVGDHDVYRS